MCCNGCPAFNNRVMYQNHSGVSPSILNGGGEDDGDVTATECKNCLTSKSRKPNFFEVDSNLTVLQGQHRSGDETEMETSPVTHVVS